VSGFGFHEARAGVLSHWVVIKDGAIKNYQAVVPTTWNAAPRNEQGRGRPVRGRADRTPIADPERPLEVWRTVQFVRSVSGVRRACPGYRAERGR